MTRIVVDCFGGDLSPSANVAGAVSALKESKDVSLILVGDEALISSELKSLNCDYAPDRIEIVDAKEVIDCNEQPTEAIKNKTDSSMVRSFFVLRERGDAMVSIGSTGALLVGSVLKIGRVKGVSRPALSPLLPTLDGGSVLFVDAGANADCKDINLIHFALMGSVYMQKILGVKNPRVALLSNGTEEIKGNELTKSVHGMLKKYPNLNFIGNIEARDILSGTCDVIVTDGFSGNICIKSMEGVAGAVFDKMKEEVGKSFFAKMGALLMKKSLRSVKNTLDYNKKGGAVFLGANKVIIKSHGSSKDTAIKNAVLQAAAACRGNLTDEIAESVKNYSDFVAAGI